MHHLTSDEADPICLRSELERNPKAVTEGEPFPILGFRGAELESTSEGFLAEAGLPDELWVASGQSRDEESGLAIARLLLERMPGEPRFEGDILLQPDESEAVLADLEQLADTVDSFVTGLRRAESTSDAPLDLCDFNHEPYRPDDWNDRRRRRSNNCYAYACNRQMPNPPQPGRGSGWGTLTRADCVAGGVDAAAVSDGLIAEGSTYLPRLQQGGFNDTSSRFQQPPLIKAPAPTKK